MSFVSEFEVLSEPVVPPVLLPAGASVPFSLKGYFLQISRLLGDGIAGAITVQVQFFPTIPFPVAANILFDLQDAGGATQVLAVNAQNQLSFAIPPGKTVVVGAQPNFTNHTATGPLAAPFGVRGYVTVDLIAPTAVGIYKLGVSPESRAIFCKLQFVSGAPSPDFSDSSDVAYALPTPSPVITVTR